jgi:YteA family regulatory protein
LDAAKREELRQKLHAEKNLLIEQIAHLEKSGLDMALGESIGELSVYDNHPADIGGEVFERGKDIALRDNAHIIVEKIEKTLHKIDDGTYEVCSICGEEIPIARLEAIPWASECIECQKKEDTLDLSRRPIEEQALKPPFSRTFLDKTHAQFVGFDGEDALQAVLRYGSSDSPQDIPGTHDYQDLFPNSNEHQGIVERTDAIPVKEHRQTEK